MKYDICIVESRDLRFEVEADSMEDAMNIAMDMETYEAVSDCYRQREHEWQAES